MKRPRVLSALRTFWGGECERCYGRVRQRGDHTCPACAEALNRSVHDPFWGAFANHPDSKLWPSRG